MTTIRSHFVKAYSAVSASSSLAPDNIPRREPGELDVEIEILYCGVCHSDLHQVRNEWSEAAPTFYPCVPGHEIIGRVSRIGSRVSKFKLGDIAAVGCMIDSCRKCHNCRSGDEQYCSTLPTFTYNGTDVHLGGHTFGGYSKSIVVEESFTQCVPAALDLPSAAPLLCAGITSYSPLRHWKVGPDKKVGIVGLGGLGHMGVKFAHALGAYVVLFTTSPGKIEDGERLGADEVIISNDSNQTKKHAASFDFILDTVSANHDINAYLKLLKLDGQLTLVGVPELPLAVAAFNVILPRRNFGGSAIGGIRETQEMLDFCAAHKLGADVELIPIQKINEAWDRLSKQDVKYRFVIDMATL
jgi:alcohol dehydrogenase (NADP+)